MPFEDHQNSVLLQGTVPAAAATAAQDQVLDRSPIAGTVQGVAIVPEANVTANGTNYRTIRLLNKKQDGTGTDVIASLALDTPTTDDLKAFDEKSIPIDTSKAKVAEGDVLAIDETVTGASGLAHSGYRIDVQIVR